VNVLTVAGQHNKLWSTTSLTESQTEHVIYSSSLPTHTMKLTANRQYFSQNEHSQQRLHGIIMMQFVTHSCCMKVSRFYLQ